MTLDFSVYIGIGQKLRKHTIKINMYLQPLISFYGYVWYTVRNICSKGGERCPFPSFLGRVWSLKLGSTLLCDLSRASFWRPWWKEAPTSRSNPATSSQNLQGKRPSGVSGKTVIWECGLSRGADRQPGCGPGTTRLQVPAQFIYCLLSNQANVKEAIIEILLKKILILVSS